MLESLAEGAIFIQRLGLEKGKGTSSRQLSGSFSEFTLHLRLRLPDIKTKSGKLFENVEPNKDGRYKATDWSFVTQNGLELACGTGLHRCIQHRVVQYVPVIGSGVNEPGI